MKVRNKHVIFNSDGHFSFGNVLFKIVFSKKLRKRYENVLMAIIRLNTSLLCLVVYLHPLLHTKSEFTANAFISHSF